MTREELQANIARVEARVNAACQRARRQRNEITVIAVSKLHPLEVVRLGLACGLTDFGENYAQELRDKASELNDPACRWHAIGHLQPKNAKYVAAVASVFHALDRLDVAQMLEQRRVGAPLDCFIEVNVAHEQTKAGLAPSELGAFLAALKPFTKLSARGLMTMPPLTDNPEDARPHFRALATLAKQHGLPWLSMGTTADFEVAIEERATHVRVGTAFFGERPA